MSGCGGEKEAAVVVAEGRAGGSEFVCGGGCGGGPLIKPVVMGEWVRVAAAGAAGSAIGATITEVRRAT